MSSPKLVAILLLAAPVALTAQDSPFHAGQWAAQFTGGFSLASVGVIKFRSATSATIMDLRLSGFHREQFASDTLVGTVSQASVDVRLGRRTYRPVADKVEVLHSLGLLVGYDHSAISAPLGGSSRLNNWEGGPFAELGAVYLVSEHVGIGATGTASLSYARSSAKSGSGATSRLWQLGGSTGIAFAATIYF